jgi:3-hydroxyisobutyrate dehydrogenase-like beta-hydroxyacid dehydrogenase
MTETIGFVGLGRMGEPMARNLLQAGYALNVYNRTAAKASALVEQGARLASQPGDAVASDGIVISIVANDEALERVTLGQGGIAEKLGENGVHLSMSTVSPETSRKLAAHHEQKGAMYVAAPVFGRPDAAAAKKLWTTLSGPDKAKDRVRTVVEALGQGVFDFGEDPGAANVVKLAGNFLIVSALEAMAEAFTLAEKNGIDRDSVASMMGQTIFSCPIYQNYGKAIASQTYEPAGFKLALGLKDVSLVLQAATASGTPMPLASLVRDRLVASIANGRQDMDWTALALSVSQDAGIK